MSETENPIVEPIETNLPKPPKKSARAKKTVAEEKDILTSEPVPEEAPAKPPRKSAKKSEPEAKTEEEAPQWDDDDGTPLFFPEDEEGQFLPEEEDALGEISLDVDPQEDPPEPVSAPKARKSLPPQKRPAPPAAESRLAGNALSVNTSADERNRLKKLFTPKRQIKNVTNDANRVKTDEDLFREATLELERATRGYILSGTVSAVNTDRFGAHAIIIYKNIYKVCIYAQQFREWPTFSLERYESEEDMYFKVLKKQIGATVDFIVMRPKTGGGIDIDNRAAIGDRMAAMRILCREFWMPDKNGQTKIRTGSRIDARVVNVTNSTAFVESGGVEIKIPSQELSWSYIQNANQKFYVGQRIPIDVTGIRYITGQDGSTRVEAQASHKTTQPNIQHEAARHLSEGMIMRGIVTNTAVASSAVFVELENGAVVRCPPPNGVFQSPVLGDSVNCLIRRVKMETNPPRIDGEIRGVLRRSSATY